MARLCFLLIVFLIANSYNTHILLLIIIPIPRSSSPQPITPSPCTPVFFLIIKQDCIQRNVTNLRRFICKRWIQFMDAWYQPWNHLQYLQKWKAKGSSQHRIFRKVLNSKALTMSPNSKCLKRFVCERNCWKEPIKQEESKRTIVRMRHGRLTRLGKHGQQAVGAERKRAQTYSLANKSCQNTGPAP